MLFTRTLPVALLTVTLLSGCAFRDTQSSDDFEMPESVSIDLGEPSEKPEGEPQQDKGTTATDSGPATAIPNEQSAANIKDQDSAAVLERLNQQPAPTLARDAEHEAQAKQAKSDFNRALNELKKGNLDSASARFDKLAKQYPALAGPIVNQAIILRKKGKPQEAYDLLQNALLTHARNPYLLNQLGVVSRELGKFKQAQVSYETAIRIDEKYPMAHYNLGVLADLYLHDPQLALNEFKIYQTLIPTPDKKVAGWIKELERRVK